MIELLKLNRKEAIRGKHSELEPKADDGIKTHSIEGLGKECSRASDCSRTVHECCNTTSTVSRDLRTKRFSAHD